MDGLEGVRRGRGRRGMELYEELKKKKNKRERERERDGGVRMDGWMDKGGSKKTASSGGKAARYDGAVRIDVFFSFFSSVSLFSFSFFSLTIVDPRQSSNRKRRQGGDKVTGTACKRRKCRKRKTRRMPWPVVSPEN